MEFNPNNRVVKLCLEAMAQKERGKAEELFRRAWQESTYDFEKFLAAHFLARHQENAADQLPWLEVALQTVLKINDDTVRSALSALYANLAKCHEALGHREQAQEYREKAASFRNENPSDKGPFYHGTRADLKVGDFLTPGRNSNYQQNLEMNHVYFTGLVNGAGLAAALAQGDQPERVYIVEPTGHFENDPNVTDKKFPGNPTRSYRSGAPLKIVGEAKEWARITPEELRQWREKLAGNKGEIIN